jgi:hypothetical protein
VPTPAQGKVVESAIRFERVAEADGPAFYELRRTAIRAGCALHYASSQLEAWTNPLSDGGLQKPLPEHFYFAKIDNQIVACGISILQQGESTRCLSCPITSGAV